MGVSLNFAEGVEPQESDLKAILKQWGYMVAEGSLNITVNEHHVHWNFVMVALISRPEPSSLFELSRQLRKVPGVAKLQISHARN